MIRINIMVLTILLLVSCQSTAQKEKKHIKPKEMTYKIEKPDSVWQDELSPAQFRILRLKGTEQPGTGEYNLTFEKGTYKCAACGTPLFDSDNKYESHCGWPSFDNAIPGSIQYNRDTSHGMIRTEIVCATCGGHLGHIFDDGPQETTGKRYCVNSLSLDFEKKE